MPSPNQALYNKTKDLLVKGILPNPHTFKTFTREELIELKAWISDIQHRLRNEEYQRKSGFKKPEVLIGLKPPPSSRSLNPKIDVLRRALRLLDIELKESEKTDGLKNNLSDMIKQWFEETAKNIERFSPARKEKAMITRRLPHARARMAELESELDTREHPPTEKQAIGERNLILLRAWTQAWREYVSTLESGSLIEEPVYNKVVGEQSIIEDLRMVSLSKGNPLYGKLKELMSDTGETFFKIAKRGKPDLNFSIFYRTIEGDFKIVDPEIFRGEHLKELSELAMLALTGNLKESDVKISPVGSLPLIEELSELAVLAVTGNLKESDVKISPVESLPLIERIESQMKEIKKQLPILSIPKMEIKWKFLKQAIHGHLLESGTDPSETTIHDVVLEILKQNEIAIITQVAFTLHIIEEYVAYFRGFFEERWGKDCFDVIDSRVDNGKGHFELRIYGIEMPSVFAEFYLKFARGLILQPYGGDLTYLEPSESSTPENPSYDLIFILNTTDYPLELWSAIDASVWDSYIKDWKKKGGYFKWKSKIEQLPSNVEIKDEMMDFSRVKIQVDAFLPAIIERNNATCFETASGRNKDAGSWVTYYLRLSKRHYGYEVYFNSIGNFFCRRFNTGETIFSDESFGDLQVAFNDLFELLNQPRDNLYGLDIDDAEAKIQAYLELAIGADHFSIDDRYSRDKNNLFAEGEGALSNFEITFKGLEMQTIFQLLYSQFEGISIEIPYGNYFGEIEGEETPEITQMRKHYEETGEISYTLLINSNVKGEYAGWTESLEDLWTELHEKIWVNKEEKEKIAELMAQTDEIIQGKIKGIIADAGKSNEIQVPEREYLLSLSANARQFACEQLIPLAIQISAEQIYAEVWDNDIERFLREDLLPSLEKEYFITRKPFFTPSEAPAWLLDLEKEIDIINLGRASLQGEATPFDDVFFYQIKPEALNIWFNDLTARFKDLTEKFNNKRKRATEIHDRLVLYLAIYADFLVCLIEYPSHIFSTASESETFIDNLIETIKQMFSEEPYQKLAEQLGQARLMQEIKEDNWDKENALKLYSHDWEDWVFIGDWNRTPHKHRRFLRLLPETDLQGMLAKLEKARASSREKKDLLERINGTYTMIKKVIQTKPSPLFRL